MPTRNPLPRATVILVCDACGATIATESFSVSHLATVLSMLRKEHARQQHGLRESG